MKPEKIFAVDDAFRLAPEANYQEAVIEDLSTHVLRFEEASEIFALLNFYREDKAYYSNKYCYTHKHEKADNIPILMKVVCNFQDEPREYVLALYSIGRVIYSKSNRSISVELRPKNAAPQSSWDQEGIITLEVASEPKEKDSKKVISHIDVCLSPSVLNAKSRFMTKYDAFRSKIFRQQGDREVRPKLNLNLKPAQAFTHR